MDDEIRLDGVETEFSDDGGEVTFVFSNDTALNITMGGQVLLYNRDNGEPMGSCSIETLWNLMQKEQILAMV